MLATDDKRLEKATAIVREAFRLRTLMEDEKWGEAWDAIGRVRAAVTEAKVAVAKEIVR